jgi:hypothetical protein
MEDSMAWLKDGIAALGLMAFVVWSFTVAQVAGAAFS